MQGNKRKSTDREQRAGKKEQVAKRRPKKKPSDVPKSGRTGPYDDPHRRPA